MSLIPWFGHLVTEMWANFVGNFKRQSGGGQCVTWFSVLKRSCFHLLCIVCLNRIGRSSNSCLRTKGLTQALVEASHAKFAKEISYHAPMNILLQLQKTHLRRKNAKKLYILLDRILRKGEFIYFRKTKFHSNPFCEIHMTINKITTQKDCTTFAYFNPYVHRMHSDL